MAISRQITGLTGRSVGLAPALGWSGYGSGSTPASRQASVAMPDDTDDVVNIPKPPDIESLVPNLPQLGVGGAFTGGAPRPGLGGMSAATAPDTSRDFMDSAIMSKLPGVGMLAPGASVLDRAKSLRAAAGGPPGVIYGILNSAYANYLGNQEYGRALGENTTNPNRSTENLGSPVDNAAIAQARAADAARNASIFGTITSPITAAFKGLVSGIAGLGTAPTSPAAPATPATTPAIPINIPYSALAGLPSGTDPMAPQGFSDLGTALGDPYSRGFSPIGTYSGSYASTPSSGDPSGGMHP